MVVEGVRADGQRALRVESLIDSPVHGPAAEPFRVRQVAVHELEIERPMLAVVAAGSAAQMQAVVAAHRVLPLAVVDATQPLLCGVDGHAPHVLHEGLRLEGHRRRGVVPPQQQLLHDSCDAHVFERVWRRKKKMRAYMCVCACVRARACSRALACARATCSSTRCVDLPPSFACASTSTS